MAVLNRIDWYDLARSTNWTPKYVTEDELFPPKLSGEFGLPLMILVLKFMNGRGPRQMPAAM